MKFIVVVAVAFLAVVCAEDDVSVVRNEQQINADGSYQYAWETSNGINVQEQGSLKQVGESQAIAAQGQFSYTSPEGQVINVVYNADENGFQPQGDHIPVPPAIPELIEKALKYLSEHPEAPAKK